MANNLTGAIIMNSFRVGIVLSFVPAILAGGCDSIDPCAQVTCDINEFCVNGACVQCERNADCDDDEYCNDGECLPECDPELCDDGNACSSDTCVDQACSNTEIPCQTSATCPPGCNGQCLGGFCYPLPF